MSESELLDLAIIILNMNNKSALTGSLMLNVRGINKRREATDIDILVQSFDDIKFLDGMTQNSPQYTDSVQYLLGDIKIDFLLNIDEPIETINDIMCGNVKMMLDRKYNYSRNDKSIESQEKHRLDLEFMNYEFPKIEEFNIDLLF